MEALIIIVGLCLLFVAGWVGYAIREIREVTRNGWVPDFPANGEVETYNLEDLVAFCHGKSRAAGWWAGAEKHDQGMLAAQKLALIHSEVSEALEGLRKGLMDDKLPHRKMVEVELADTVIRVFDLCGYLNLDLSGAVAEKLEYNSKREDHKPENRQKDGGKKF